ncbi:neuronal acetylcholine receptor subunit beta-3-like [Lineus longissimus]|uniref:neuronal acetylcholine receptor subunit beta-3-like n=1 Tax=Lineus longissimus TaxID=88925 RepID=UPI00315C584B
MMQWTVTKTFSVSCTFDMTIFPFDTQICAATFGSVTQKGSSLYYKKAGYSTWEFAMPNTEWDLVNFTDSAIVVPMSVEFNDAGSVYNWTEAVYRVDLTLKRRTGYYWVNLITPCMCCSFLVAMTFYMPCDAGEKLSFSVTVLLAFTVYQLIIADNLPRSSDRTPLLSIYLTLLTGLSASAVTLAMFVLNLHHHDPNKPVPSWMKTLVFNCLATITCKRKAVRELGLVDSPDQLNQVQPICLQSPHPKVAFVEGASKGSITDLHDLLKKSNVISPDGNSEGTYGPHWKLAAEIIDRFFMIVFLCSTLALTGAIMFIMPYLYVSSLFEAFMNYS